MKNLMKYVIVMLTALSFSAVNAGELSVAGAAKNATYSVASSDGSAAGLQQGKGWNYLTITLVALIELDNGSTLGASSRYEQCNCTRRR